MNTEREQPAQEDVSTIDSIAMEALSPEAISGEQPCSHPDDSGARPSVRQTQNVGLNMEHVDGQPIDEYCDCRRLDVPARLKLFKQVCDAVHLAHQHRIIHCELKPRNILITPDGVPKLINFGNTTSLLGRCGGDAAIKGRTTLMQTAELALTPEYASPEQVEGETITTASDIYSLGVILYVLLTGRGPYWLKTGDVSEVLRAICEQVPERPSQIAATHGGSVERLRRALGRDLDSIILLAMRKEPEGRYRSADHFANDLERYLQGLPVYAHRGSVAYQAIKFMRRHVLAVTISGVLLSALTVGVVGTVTGLILARRDRDRSLGSFRQAHQTVNRFFNRVSLERLLNQPGLHPLRNALLDDAQRFYEDFLRSRSGDRSLRAELASARTHLAQISSMTGSTTEAISQFQQAIVLWEDLVAAQPANPAYREELARTLNEQGLVIMRLKGRLAEAIRIFHRALELIEPQVADSHSPAASHELCMILLNIGEAQREQGQLKEATQSIQQSLMIEASLATESPSSLESSISMARGHVILGQIFLGDSGGSGPALVEYQQAILLLENVTHLHPELSDQALELALLFGDLNRLQQMEGRLDSALLSAGKAVEILEQLNRKHPGVVNYEQGLADNYHMMSDLHRQRREPTEGLAYAQKAQTLLGRMVELHPEIVSLRLDLAKSQNNLGRMLQQTGEPVDALRSFQRAVDIYESMPELDPRDSYLLACNIALSIRLIGVKNGSGDTIELSKLSKADLLRRDRYGNRAVELLRRALRAGSLDFDVLESETDLDPLRDRPDFQSLISEDREKTTNAKE
jgi:eukaryotic-like serine/threonine-protein kinase